MDNQKEKTYKNTEWIIAGNPDKYDVVEAFRKLGSIDWVQSTNVAVGDIVYTYVSNTIRAIQFKCKVNAVNKTKPTIDDSSLPDNEKNRLKDLLDTIWTRTQNGEYTNNEGKDTNFGMFGTGFFSFLNKTDEHSPCEFIQMCIDIKDMDNDDEIFNRCEQTLNESFHGMRAASASMVLHCLKPMVFPIFNSNMGADNIYVYFHTGIKRKTELYAYIKNVKLVKAFRDRYFKVKNYRIFDIAAWDLGESRKHTNIDYLGVLDYLNNYRELSYRNPEIKEIDATEKERLLDIKTHGRNAVAEMKKMSELCEEKYGLDRCEPMSWLDGSNTKTRKYLWAQLKYSKYADNPISISISVEISPQSNKARYRFSLEIKNDDADIEQLELYHSYLDLTLQPESTLVYMLGSSEAGRPEIVNETADEIKQKLQNGIYKKVQIGRIEEWTDRVTNDDMEEAMLEAIKELIPYYKHVIGDTNRKKEDVTALEEENLSGKMREANKMFDKNLILYGPPGTGKTYNSVKYAVAICDGKSVEELTDYDVVMARYKELKKTGRIAFATFHQSYGYEEFIEGIKPIIDENKQEIGYTIESGIFKEFCENAKSMVRTQNSDSIDAGARIWKLTIMNGDLNQIKQECFEENNVRMGFDMESDEARSFVEDVKLGDIILSFKTRKAIDGIAIVTDEAVELKDKSMYKTARPVKWLAKNINVDITDINNGKLLHRMTFAKVPNMNVKDVIELAEKVNPGLESTVIEENTEPHVFIIDEINRGNISKIFGELITLIENTKRAGMSEAASAILPYSGDEFSVPSNVYILGTMNTADRSIALIDTALRRRFQFVEMMPDSAVLRKIHADKVEDLDVAAMLDKINERITFLYDREHTIGHAFLQNLRMKHQLKNCRIFLKSR